MPAAVDASMLSNTSPDTYFSCTGRLNSFRPKLFSKAVSGLELRALTARVLMAECSDENFNMMNVW